MTDEALVIDAQLLQTGAWDRGMGGYSLSLLAAYAKRPGHTPATFILNKHLDFPEDRKKKLLEFYPDAKLVFLDLPARPGDIYAAQKQAKHTLNAYIGEHHHGQRVNFLILGPFMFDYCSAFPDHVRKLMLFYDLIPLIRWSDFSHHFPASHYFPRLNTVLEADLLFAISATTKNQLETELSIPESKVINLNGARVKREVTAKKGNVEVPKRFVLMPSGDLPHKNNVHAVKAFAEFNRQFGDTFTLVITSSFSDKTQELLGCYSEHLLFTGNVSEETLEYLYQKSEAVMLISYIEGLGLPLLEAASYDKPVVCSTIPVFQEISSKAFYFCDPDRPSAIAGALQAAVTKRDWAMRLEEYQRIAGKYDWDVSAESLAQGLYRRETDIPVPRKERYAFVLPHPATTSGKLGHQVQSLAPAFAKSADVRYFVAPDDYVDTNQKPYFLDDIASANGTRSCSPDVIQGHKTAYYLDETTASVDVAVRALAFPSVCFVAPGRMAPLLKALTAAGYIDPAVAKEWNSRHGGAGVVKLLESVGNKVYFLADLDGYAPNDPDKRNNSVLAERILAKL